MYRSITLVQNDHPMVTRAKARISKPSVFLAHSEPSLVKEALSQPHWFSRMKFEYDSLLKNGTWVLTTLPSNMKTIGCKWVFKVKENPYGSVNKYKSRLVAKAFHQ